jgi:hydroxymethylbilane synthase
MRIATRASALALAQAQHVARALADAGIHAELVPMSTRGDRGKADRAAQDNDANDHASRGDVGGGRAVAGNSTLGGTEDKSRWVADLQGAIAAGDVDIAVHSAKDVPGELPDGLALLATPARGPVEDALCGARSLQDLPAGARVGTSSLRRAAQLRAAREDIDVRPVTGNVDTRLRKLAETVAGERVAFDALVLASAGLQRLRRESEIGALLDARRFVPAPGQGAIALEGRADDAAALSAARAIGDERTFACLRAERALARELGASCNSALGAHALTAPDGGGFVLRAWVGRGDGSQWIFDELAGDLAAPEALASALAARLRLAGAASLLDT